MQGLGFFHLRATFQKLVRQHNGWKALLTEEISKAEKLIDTENLKQNRRDDSRDIGRKHQIFKNGIKGTKKMTGKYNTSKSLMEVKIQLPVWIQMDMERGRIPPIAQQEREKLITIWIKKCTTKLRIHSTKLSQQGVELR